MRARLRGTRPEALALVAIILVVPDVLEGRHVPHNLGRKGDDIARTPRQAPLPRGGHDEGDDGPEGDARDETRPPHDEAADPVHDDDDGGDDGEGDDEARGALVLGHGIEEAIDERADDGEDGGDGVVDLEGGSAQEHLDGGAWVQDVRLEVVDHLGREERGESLVGEWIHGCRIGYEVRVCRIVRVATWVLSGRCREVILSVAWSRWWFRGRTSGIDVVVVGLSRWSVLGE